MLNYVHSQVSCPVNTKKRQTFLPPLIKTSYFKGRHCLLFSIGQHFERHPLISLPSLEKQMREAFAKRLYRSIFIIRPQMHNIELTNSSLHQTLNLICLQKYASPVLYEEQDTLASLFPGHNDNTVHNIRCKNLKAFQRNTQSCRLILHHFEKIFRLLNMFEARPSWAPFERHKNY